MAGGHSTGESPKIDLNKVYRPPVAPKTLPKVGAALYNTVLKRNSTFVVFMVVGAIVVEGVVNWGVDSAWNRANRGKQWNDIKDKY